MQTKEIPHTLFALLIDRTINRDQFLILCWRNSHKRFPNYLESKQLKIMPSSYYRLINKSQAIWEEYFAFENDKVSS